VFIGQRNWHPFLEDTLNTMAKKGVKRAIGFPSAAHRCEASWERYVKAVEEAKRQIGGSAPIIDYVEPWFDHPLFIEAICERVNEVIKAPSPLVGEGWDGGHPPPSSSPTRGEEIMKAAWIFTAHSIPIAMAESAQYVQELERTAGLVAQKFGKKKWRLAYSSRSGRPEDPWLEPDVCDVIREEAARGIKKILFIPIGFIADHVEILFDLDIEAKEAADSAEYVIPCGCWQGIHENLMDSPPKTAGNDSPKRVIVIGGGVTGLAAAWRLTHHFQKSGLPLTLQLLESSPHLGGSLKSACREGFLLEMGADCFISEKPRGIELCRELGLESQLIGTRPEYRRSFILKQGKFHPIPEGFYLMGPSRTRPFLESGLLTWPGKFRAMLEPLIPSRPQTDETLASFVRRRFGKEMLDWMAQPLIAGIYGANPEALSLRATFPQFLDMERTYGSVIFGLKKRGGSTSSASGARYNLFVTLRDGMQKLTDTLAAKLGTSVVTSGARVKDIRHADGFWQVVKASGEILTADAVCVALPSYAAAELFQNLDPDLAGELAAIAYAPAATINFAFREMDVKRPLNGIGFVVPRKENRLVLGCTFIHHKFEGRAPKGFMLIRVFLGGVQNTDWMKESDEVVTQNVFAELKDWLQVTGNPMFTQLERYPRALPQYSVGHLTRILRVEERLFRHKGLALAGNWQYGVGIPDCIESGERAADALAAHLSRVAENAL